MDMKPEKTEEVNCTHLDKTSECAECGAEFKLVPIEEAHETENGYCCACDYDIAGFEEKIKNAEAKIERGAEDFNNRFTGVMKDLAK